MSIGQHILAALDGPVVTPLVKDLILKEKILGFTLFKRNIESAAQVTALNAELQALAKQAGYELLLAVDQEGGRVARLQEPEFTKIPPMRTWGETYHKQDDLNAFYILGHILANEVKACGFNLNFAPTVDVDVNPNNPIIGDRSFSSEPALVAEMASEVIHGLRDQGVIACLKHFPGHGATTKDSHIELPIDQRAEIEIQNGDESVYQKLIELDCAPAIMTAHVVYPHIDSANPATLSEKIIHDHLRTNLNYTGVIFSDDLFMKAITHHHSFFTAADTFFKAGGDVILMCEQPQITLDLIEEFKSTSDKNLKHHLDQAAQRIAKLKQDHRQRHSQKSQKTLAELVSEHRQFIKEHFESI